MQLNNFRFQVKYKKGIEAFDNIFLQDIRKIISKDRGVFELANQFFYINSNNFQPVSDAQESLELEKEIIEVESKYPITDGYAELADELIYQLVSLFGKKLNEYKKIRNQYIELITLYWKAIPGSHSKVYHEPVIYYKRNKCFAQSVYSDIKCDIVHIDFNNRCFEMYECKTTMLAFLLDLSTDERIGKDKKHKKTIARSKRKQNYLNAFYTLIKTKIKKLSSYEIAYVTLAPKVDTLIKNKNVHQIGNIPIISREDLGRAFKELSQ